MPHHHHAHIRKHRDRSFLINMEVNALVIW